MGIITPWLFYSKRFKDKCHDRAFDIRIKKYCDLADLDIEKSMHKIRSTFISNLRDSGVTYEKIAEWVGHKDIRTTQQHYSFDLKSDEENREMLNNLSYFKRSNQK